MPHLIIHYAKELDSKPGAKRLVESVYQGALASGLFSAPGIKVRAQAFEHFQTGESDLPFIHVEARILGGRTADQKSALSALILQGLSELPLASVSLTVEVVDMHNPSYAKLVK
ncbi:5-carboxymethyl-2-hydroxymuconate Delta-isomerase [Aliiglaciecola sp. CAU 1673]|uniref:5-carboxymethyl-2-hydroxymuconate Delta-isomerase n=1 Tax=Aliiglaciecola sp. CAU 1673 TaxID=3032595 RepID=UPI0023DA8403|nr:5-carboxymethyl-2-hydroxymuconate Delta-isomerase [Aliiglaciecola sp. CAU 1673]MDF2179770.1 5-carboxymethyl-2-hydroxymuconate Delta-isomerase [Aliiglaciecola sp. CAU 1673]